MKQPSFFFDEKRGYEKEIFIDYFLSWTLRCAVDENSNIDNTVQQYSKFVLLFLLKYNDKERFKNMTLDNTTIKRVETEKQWKQIDLFCIVHLEFDGEMCKYILIFENKMYSPLKEHQLKTYQETVENQRNNKYPNYIILKFFIHCYPNFDKSKEELFGYIPIHIYEISGALKIDHPEVSGNALFDEFWYNYI